MVSTIDIKMKVIDDYQWCHKEPLGDDDGDGDFGDGDGVVYYLCPPCWN